MTKRVVITGGAGFIGSNLCRRMTAEGFDVIALDDLSTGRQSNLDGVSVSLVEASILDLDQLRLTFSGATSIIHLAARPSVPRSIADPMATHTINATGTANVLEAARSVGCNHVIVASSSSVYGNSPMLPKHEDLPPSPRSPYAASKLATESYSLAWAASFDMNVLALRFFNVFGPLQPADHAYAAVIPAFISAALSEQSLPVHGDGHQTRDFTFVDSVTSVITDAVQRQVHFSAPVNLAFGGRYSLIEVIKMLEGILGRTLPRNHLRERPGDVRDSQADQRRLRSLFPGILPVDLRLGLERTVEWFASTTTLRAP